MKAATTKVYKFGPFSLDTGRHLLLKDGSPLQLREKIFDTLLILVEARGAVVSKDEFMEKVWPDAFVEENSLNVNVSALRKVFGERPHEHRFIVTVPGVGEIAVGDRIIEGGWDLGFDTLAFAFSPSFTLDGFITTRTLLTGYSVEGATSYRVAPQLRILGTGTVQVAPVPEPSAILLVGAGALLAIRTRRCAHSLSAAPDSSARSPRRVWRRSATT